MFGQAETVVLEKIAQAVANQVDKAPNSLGTLAYVIIFVGGLVCIAFGVLLFKLLTYMRQTYADANNSIQAVVKAHSETVNNLALKHETVCNTLTESFDAECAAQRADGRKTIDVCGQVVHDAKTIAHDARQLAQQVVTTKELNEKLQHRLADGK